MLHQKQISSLQGLLQNQSLETILICNVVLCFPNNNIVCTHLCDECKRDQIRQTFVSDYCSDPPIIAENHDELWQSVANVSER